MLKIAIAAGLMLTPALVSAQLGNSMGTQSSAQPHSAAGDMASGAAGTPTGRAQRMHSRSHHATGSSSMAPMGAASNPGGTNPSSPSNASPH